MNTDCEIINPESKPLILAAIHDDVLWNELKDALHENFRVRREVNGLRAIDVLLLLRPAAVIAETGLPGLSGILLARLIGHNRHLTKLPVALILSREFLIEDFWAKDSGATAVIPRQKAHETISVIETAIRKDQSISENDWNEAEKAIIAQGGPAAGVANELERQLIGASIIARLGEIEIASEHGSNEQQSTIPVFIRKALSALASVLEFAQAGVTLFETNDMYIVENEIFSEIPDRDAFVRESGLSASLYHAYPDSASQMNVHYLLPMRHELPGPRGPASTFFALPLSGRSGNYGLLSLMTYKEIAVREYYLHTLSLIGSQLAVTLERALFYEEVRRLSVTDSLTGLSNRRAILARIDEEYKRSTRYGSVFSMAICDLDDFKKLNDTYGHQAGDAVLKAVAEVLRRSVREVDLAGRWGGEEMALLFPSTDTAGAITACERIREEIENLVIRYRDIDLKTTLSMGVATIDPNSVSPKSSGALIGYADRAMYLAKERGKNRVVSFLELPETSKVP